MKVLALLVESGMIYCMLLVSNYPSRGEKWPHCSHFVSASQCRTRHSQFIVFVYEVTPALFATPDVHQSTYLRAVADYTYACFIPTVVSGRSIYSSAAPSR